LSRVDEAVACFRQGGNCAQAILSTYGTQYGLDRQLALRLAVGLGGGLGCEGEVCGAVNGAALTIGLKVGSESEVGSREAKKEAYRKVRQFSERFKALHGSLACREILGCDLSTEEGLQEAREKDLFSKVCPGFVADAARILEELLAE